MFPFLTLIAGPGIFVNLIGKEMWGRPRPVNCIELGGTRISKRFEINPKRRISLSLGHAASGFHLCTMALLFKGKWKLLSICLFSTWGMLVSLGRILQGGHFLSDVIGSLFIVTLVAVVFYPTVSRKQTLS